MTNFSQLIIPQDQSKLARMAVLENLIKKHISAPSTVIEIGVWYGLGSTSLWLKNLHPGSHLILLDAWKPYASNADITGMEMRPKFWNYPKMDSLTTEAFLSAFLNIRTFENEFNSFDVTMIRGNSHSVLPLLKADSFDVIYIDGDHKYSSAKADIVSAKHLINKNFGIICGDDLEKLPTPELLDIALQYKDRDYLRGDCNFHPGVCLAVAEEFLHINMVEGFWWVFCVNGAFTCHYPIS